MNEGILDRAARQKRESEARIASEISGLKLQRALLVTAVFAAGGYAGYLYLEGAKKSEAVLQAAVVTQKAEVSKTEAAKESSALRDKLVAMDRSLNDERSKSSAFEAEIASLRTDKATLQSKVDGFVAAAATPVIKPAEVIVEAVPARSPAVPTPVSVVSKAPTFASKLTKDEAAKIARDAKSFYDTINTAANSSSVPSENARRIVVRALELYKADKADFDAAAAAKGLTIPDLRSAVARAVPVDGPTWLTDSGSWTKVVGSKKSAKDSTTFAEANHRHFLNASVPFVKALADITAEAAK